MGFFVLFHGALLQVLVVYLILLMYAQDFVLLNMFWFCSGFVLVLFWFCSGFVLVLFWFGSGLVLVWFWFGSGLVLSFLLFVFETPWRIHLFNLSFSFSCQFAFLCVLYMMCVRRCC